MQFYILTLKSSFPIGRLSNRYLRTHKVKANQHLTRRGMWCHLHDDLSWLESNTISDYHQWSKSLWLSKALEMVTSSSSWLWSTIGQSSQGVLWDLKIATSPTYNFLMHIASIKTPYAFMCKSSQSFWHFGVKDMILCTMWTCEARLTVRWYFDKDKLQLRVVVQMLGGYVRNLLHYWPSPWFGERVQSHPLRSN